MRLFRKKSQKSLGMLGVTAHQSGVGVALVVCREDARPELVCTDFAPCADPKDRGRSLLELVARNHLDEYPCVGVMNPGSYDLLQVELPAAGENELRETLRWQIKDLIDYPAADAIIDLFHVPQRGRDAVAYVVSARPAEVKRQVELLHQARLDIAAIDIPELAIKNLVAHIPAPEGGRGVLFLATEQGAITVINGEEVLFSRTINFGVSGLCEGASDRAADPGEPQSYRPTLDAVALEVQRTFEFCERNWALPPIETLVTLPTEQPVPELGDHLAEFLGTRVQQLDINMLLETDTAIPHSTQARCLLAVGAALRDPRSGP